MRANRKPENEILEDDILNKKLAKRIGLTESKAELLLKVFYKIKEKIQQLQISLDEDAANAPTLIEKTKYLEKEIEKYERIKKDDEIKQFCEKIKKEIAEEKNEGKNEDIYSCHRYVLDKFERMFSRAERQCNIIVNFLENKIKEMSNDAKLIQELEQLIQELEHIRSALFFLVSDSSIQYPDSELGEIVKAFEDASHRGDTSISRESVVRPVMEIAAQPSFEIIADNIEIAESWVDGKEAEAREKYVKVKEKREEKLKKGKSALDDLSWGDEVCFLKGLNKLLSDVDPVGHLSSGEGKQIKKLTDLNKELVKSKEKYRQTYGSLSRSFYDLVVQTFMEEIEQKNETAQYLEEILEDSKKVKDENDNKNKPDIDSRLRGILKHPKFLDLTEKMTSGQVEEKVENNFQCGEVFLKVFPHLLEAKIELDDIDTHRAIAEVLDDQVQTVKKCSLLDEGPFADDARNEFDGLYTQPKIDFLEESIEYQIDISHQIIGGVLQDDIEFIPNFHCDSLNRFKETLLFMVGPLTEVLSVMTLQDGSPAMQGIISRIKAVIGEDSINKLDDSFFSSLVTDINAMRSEIKHRIHFISHFRDDHQKNLATAIDKFDESMRDLKIDFKRLAIEAKNCDLAVRTLRAQINERSERDQAREKKRHQLSKERDKLSKKQEVYTQNLNENYSRLIVSTYGIQKILLEDGGENNACWRELYKAIESIHGYGEGDDFKDFSRMLMKETRTYLYEALKRKEDADKKPEQQGYDEQTYLEEYKSKMKDYIRDGRENFANQHPELGGKLALLANIVTVLTAPLLVGAVVMAYNYWSTKSCFFKPFQSLTKWDSKLKEIEQKVGTTDVNEDLLRWSKSTL